MFQLRSFVHQRLYAAAEEILGEVEKTMKLVLYEAELHRQKEELGNLPQQVDSLHQISATESPLTISSVTGEGLLQETSPSTKEESNLSTAEVPGPSQTTAYTINSDGNYCIVPIDFKIKEEQEELADDSQTQEVIFSFPGVVKSEQDQPETQASYEFQPASPDCSAAQSERNGSDEEFVQSKGTRAKMLRRMVLQRQYGRMTQKGHTALPDGDSSAKGQKGRHVCPICGKGLQYVLSFMKHIKTHKGSSECRELLCHLQKAYNKPLLCDVCGKAFSLPSSLKTHLKIHTGIKDFKCQDCGKTFIHKHQLTVHMMTHTGEKPFRCRLCEKRFYTSSQLKRHMKYGKKIYSCDICGEDIAHKKLFLHMNAHTAGGME